MTKEITIKFYFYIIGQRIAQQYQKRLYISYYGNVNTILKISLGKFGIKNKPKYYVITNKIIRLKTTG